MSSPQKFGSHMSPRELVAQLDRFIVGQHDAKRAVAVALRNRWRRSRVAAEMREEVSPKNILMIGPTGCGKTEIARRVAKLACAPFVKVGKSDLELVKSLSNQSVTEREREREKDCGRLQVEATKFTEVGFHGQDVDTIIRDLAGNIAPSVALCVSMVLRSEVALKDLSNFLSCRCRCSSCEAAAQGSQFRESH